VPINLFSNPLFVGAHADDVEFFAGGTLSRFAATARVVVFSLHKGQRSPSPRKELEEAMHRLGVSANNLFSSYYPACMPPPDSFMNFREDLAKILCKCKPASVVVTHQSTDTNQDHKMVHDEVKRVFRDTPIICGRFGFNDLPPAERAFFVALTPEQARAKVEALEMYESQRMRHRRYFDPAVLLTEMEFFGSLIGVDYAEAFEVVRLWI